MITSRFEPVGRASIEARAVRVAPARTPVWRRLMRRHVALPVVLLFAMLALATAAIVYISWPLVFALIVVGAAAWCWRLDQEQDQSTATRTSEY